jgi:hypothetical protein
LSTYADVVIRDVIASLPAASIPGRLFISSDTHVVLRDNGTSWDNVVAGGGFSAAPLTPFTAPNGSTTYTLPITPVNPTASMYFLNGVKKQYGVYYSISGNTLTILNTYKPDVATGDTYHEIYAS